MSNLFEIKEFITGDFVRVIYQIGLAITIIAGIILAFSTLFLPSVMGIVLEIFLLITIIIVTILACLWWRIICECIIVFFSIHEQLKVIAKAVTAER